MRLWSWPIKNPLIRASDITDIKAFVADPFMFRRDSTWYMFFEVLNALDGRGDIGLAVSRDGYKWEYSKIVLDEPFHLSYPYVFEWDGEIYMIPRVPPPGIYVFTVQLISLVAGILWTLLEGEFGTMGYSGMKTGGGLWRADPYRNNSLRLYYTDDLRGAWKEHPMSPIVKDDANIARPGGRIIMHEGKIYRLAQDCDPTYGKSLTPLRLPGYLLPSMQKSPEI